MLIIMMTDRASNTLLQWAERVDFNGIDSILIVSIYRFFIYLDSMNLCMLIVRTFLCIT